MGKSEGCPHTESKWRTKDSHDNIVLVSGVQQSDSVIHVYIFFIFFSVIGYYKTLNIVPSAIQ